MKKVLFVITGLGHSKLSGIGGSDKRAIEIINNLDKKSYIPFLICPVNSINILKGHLKRNINIIKIYPSKYARFLNENLLSRFLSYLEIIIFRTKISLNENFDLIYSTSDCISDILLTIHLSRKHFIKNCVILHHRVPSPMFRKGTFLVNLVSYFLQKITNKLVSNNFKHIFFYKTFEGRKFSKNFKKNSKYFINNGIDLIKQKKNNSNRNKIIFVGGMRFSKGIGDLIEIGNIIKSKKKKINIDIYGGGGSENVAYFKRNIQKFHLDRILTYQGSKNKDEIRKIMTSSKILILPSYEEGWSIVVYEALYYGCQVIAYNLPSFFHLKEYIHLVNSYKQMFNKIDQILVNEHSLKNYPPMEFFDKLSWINIAKEEKIIFDHILNM